MSPGPSSSSRRVTAVTDFGNLLERLLLCVLCLFVAQEICVVTRASPHYLPGVLSEKPWKSDAILRLGLSLFLCQFLGALGLAVARFFTSGQPLKAWIFCALVAAGGRESTRLNTHHSLIL